MDKFRIDGEKLHFHPRRVTQLLDGREDWESAKDIYPLYVEVSPAGGCNHRCTMCAIDYTGYHPNLLDADVLGDRLIEMQSLGVRSVMFAGEGEPLLHKRINEISQGAIRTGLDVAFTTNGVLLDKLDLTGVSWVKVSINAGMEDTYAKVHQTHKRDWRRVWRNLENAVKRKGDCTIGVQMVLLPENEHEAAGLQAECDAVGVDYLVLKPFSQHKMSINRQYENFIPIVPEATARTVVRHEAIATREIPYEKCQATPYLWAYVMANGDLYSCSAYLLDDRFKLGNLNEQTFRQIWHGEKRKANWEFVRNGLDIHECRVNCRMDKSNRYLTDLIHGVPHGNFV